MANIYNVKLTANVKYGPKRYIVGDRLEVTEEEYKSLLKSKLINDDHTEKVKKQEADDPMAELEGKSVDELKVYAEKNGIDIGNASSVNGILKKIKEAAEKAE